MLVEKKTVVSNILIREILKKFQKELHNLKKEYTTQNRILQILLKIKKRTKHLNFKLIELQRKLINDANTKLKHKLKQCTYLEKHLNTENSNIRNSFITTFLIKDSRVTTTIPTKRNQEIPNIIYDYDVDHRP